MTILASSYQRDPPARGAAAARKLPARNEVVAYLVRRDELGAAARLYRGDPDRREIGDHARMGAVARTGGTNRQDELMSASRALLYAVQHGGVAAVLDACREALVDTDDGPLVGRQASTVRRKEGIEDGRARRARVQARPARGLAPGRGELDVDAALDHGALRAGPSDVRQPTAAEIWAREDRQVGFYHVGSPDHRDRRLRNVPLNHVADERRGDHMHPLADRRRPRGVDGRTARRERTLRITGARRTYRRRTLGARRIVMPFVDWQGCHGPIVGEVAPVERVRQRRGVGTSLRRSRPVDQDRLGARERGEVRDRLHLRGRVGEAAEVDRDHHKGKEDEDRDPDHNEPDPAFSLPSLTFHVRPSFDLSYMEI